MKKPQPSRISVSLALDSLIEATDECNRAQDIYQQKKAVRDDLIRDAIDSGVTMTRVSRITGLSREWLYKITRNPYSEDKRAV